MPNVLNNAVTLVMAWRDTIDYLLNKEGLNNENN